VRLERALERLFPFARAITVTHPLAADGSLMAELLLPVRAGESRLQVCRFPPEAAEEWSELLRWRGPYRRASFGEGRWGFLAAWDGVASIEEVQALLIARVVRDPELGDPG
jgi:hypothetical protein